MDALVRRPGAISDDESCRRIAHVAASYTHCEVVLPDGRQVTLYTRDIPHAVPIPSLDIGVISASRVLRQITFGVQRSLPLSSAHGNSEFRIAILFNPPKFAAVGE